MQPFTTIEIAQAAAERLTARKVSAPASAQLPERRSRPVPRPILPTTILSQVIDKNTRVTEATSSLPPAQPFILEADSAGLVVAVGGIPQMGGAVGVSAADGTSAEGESHTDGSERAVTCIAEGHATLPLTEKSEALPESARQPGAPRTATGGDLDRPAQVRGPTGLTDSIEAREGLFEKPDQIDISTAQDPIGLAQQMARVNTEGEALLPEVLQSQESAEVDNRESTGGAIVATKVSGTVLGPSKRAAKRQRRKLRDVEAAGISVAGETAAADNSWLDSVFPQTAGELPQQKRRRR